MQIYFLYVLRLFFVACVALFWQLPSMAQTAQEDASIERFDIETFNRNKYKYAWSYVLSDGTKVYEWENSGYGYQRETVLPNSAYTRIKLFNDEGCLIGENLKFFNIFIGISNEYDGEGHLIKEFNQDEEFEFSIDDLIQKMKNEYNVDITDKRQTFSVGRGIYEIDEKVLPIYYVYVYFYKGGSATTSQTMAYLFHGSTGDLLYRITADLEGSPSIISEYYNSRSHEGMN